MNNSFTDILSRGASCYGISLDDNTIKSFAAYTDVLKSWNSRMNLVSDRDMDRFVEYHLLDSLKVAACIDFSGISKLLDFGTGAGLPGIPLALAFSHLNVTLVDSRLKRCDFLEAVLKEIPTVNACVIRSRVENLPETYNKTFDMVSTRATVKLNDYFRLSSRFISHGGTLVAIKGDTIEDELNELFNYVDTRFFNISSTVPKAFNNVRQGNVVIITHI